MCFRFWNSWRFLPVYRSKSESSTFLIEISVFECIPAILIAQQMKRWEHLGSCVHGSAKFDFFQRTNRKLSEKIRHYWKNPKSWPCLSYDEKRHLLKWLWVDDILNIMSNKTLLRLIPKKHLLLCFGIEIYVLGNLSMHEHSTPYCFLKLLFKYKCLFFYSNSNFLSDR